MRLKGRFFCKSAKALLLRLGLEQNRGLRAEYGVSRFWCPEILHLTR